MIQAVKDLHDSGMAHLDIKPDNFVVKEDFKIALIDFGLSENVNSVLTIRTGTPEYYPPEMMMRAELINYSAQQADIWTLGMSLFIVLALKRPYGIKDLKEDNYLRLIKERDFQGFFKAHSLDTLPESYKLRIFSCLSFEKSRRP